MKNSRQLAIELLLEYLQNGEVTFVEIEEVNIDAEEDIISSKKIKKKIRKPTPKWVIERVLGKSISDIDSLKSLVDNGWLEYNQLEKIEKLLNEFNDNIKQIISTSSDI